MARGTDSPRLRSRDAELRLGARDPLPARHGGAVGAGPRRAGTLRPRPPSALRPLLPAFPSASAPAALSAPCPACGALQGGLAPGPAPRSVRLPLPVPPSRPRLNLTAWSDRPPHSGSFHPLPDFIQSSGAVPYSSCFWMVSIFQPWKPRPSQPRKNVRPRVPDNASVFFLKSSPVKSATQFAGFLSFFFCLLLFLEFSTGALVFSVNFSWFHQLNTYLAAIDNQI